MSVFREITVHVCVHEFIIRVCMCICMLAGDGMLATKKGCDLRNIQHQKKTQVPATY